MALTLVPPFPSPTQNTVEYMRSACGAGEAQSSKAPAFYCRFQEVAQHTKIRKCISRAQLINKFEIGDEMNGQGNCFLTYSNLRIILN